MPRPSRTSRSRAVSLATFCVLWGRKSSGSTCSRVDHLDVREDDLQGPLEDLGLAPNVQVVAGLERPGQSSLAFQSRAPTLPELVPELQVEVEVALAVGPELLVGDEEDLVDRISVGQLVDDIDESYASSIGRCGSDGRGHDRAAPARSGPIVGGSLRRGQGTGRAGRSDGSRDRALPLPSEKWLAVRGEPGTISIDPRP